VWFFADTAIINTVMIAGGAANTCDRYESTTMNLTLDPNNAVATSQTISQCGNYTAGDGTVLDSTITHVFTTASILTGCDSTVTVNYTNTYMVDSAATDILSCDDWTSPGGTSIAASGQVIDTVDTGAGCHVREIYNVTINSGTNDTVFQVLVLYVIVILILMIQTELYILQLDHICILELQVLVLMLQGVMRLLYLL
jgi:hypothetical protein